MNPFEGISAAIVVEATFEKSLLNGLEYQVFGLHYAESNCFSLPIISISFSTDDDDHLSISISQISACVRWVCKVIALGQVDLIYILDHSPFAKCYG